MERTGNSIVAFKRFFLIALLSLTGLVAIGTVAAALANSGSFMMGDLVLVTGMGTGFLLLMAFAAFTAIERPYVRIIAIVGIFFAMLMLPVLPVYAWWEASATRFGARAHEQSVSQLVVTALLTVAVFCLVPLVMSPRMKTNGRIVQGITVACMVGTYALFLATIWDLTRSIESGEALAAGLIFSGAGTLCVFALNKFVGIKVPDPLTSVAGSLHLRCPRCAMEQEVALGESACCGCKLKFRIEVEEPRCPKCGYNLHTLTARFARSAGRRWLPRRPWIQTPICWRGHGQTTRPASNETFPIMGRGNTTI